MGIESAKVCTWTEKILVVAACKSPPRSGVPDQPLISLMHNDLTKSSRIALKSFFPWSSIALPVPASGANSALKYPNAHRVGKNDRAGIKKLSLGKIYTPGTVSSR
jgi:hypothetical protein